MNCQESNMICSGRHTEFLNAMLNHQFASGLFLNKLSSSLVLKQNLAGTSCKRVVARGFRPCLKSGMVTLARGSKIINPVGVQLFSYVNTFFCSNKFVWLLDT